MSKPLTMEQMPSDLRDHRAVTAWYRARPGASSPKAPKRIDILKLKNKSAVYRLVGVGPGGVSVIAKRCRIESANVERLIHQDFMKRFPLPALRYYGFLEDGEEGYCWLFIENAAGEEYSPLSAPHRALAANWLAALHTAAITSDLSSRLPSREPVDYRNVLRTSRGIFQQHLASPILEEADLRVLESIISHCNLIEAHWGELEEMCDRMPRTLVHGDLVIKNVSVKKGKAGPALLAFDWEVAGWGVPATDFAQFTGRTVSPDLEAYYSALKPILRRYDFQALERLALCGKIFRLIDDLSWAAACMGFNSYEEVLKPMFGLMSYESRIAWALREMKWIEPVSTTTEVPS